MAALPCADGPLPDVGKGVPLQFRGGIQSQEGQAMPQLQGGGLVRQAGGKVLFAQLLARGIDGDGEVGVGRYAEFEGLLQEDLPGCGVE